MATLTVNKTSVSTGALKRFSNKTTRTEYVNGARTLSFANMIIVGKPKKDVLMPVAIAQCNSVFVEHQNHLSRISNCDRVIVRNLSSVEVIENCNTVFIEFGGRVDKIINCKEVYRESWGEKRLKNVKITLFKTLISVVLEILGIGILLFSDQVFLAAIITPIAMAASMFGIGDFKDYVRAKKYQKEQSMTVTSLNQNIYEYDQPKTLGTLPNKVTNKKINNTEKEFKKASTNFISLSVISTVLFMSILLLFTFGLGEYGFIIAIIAGIFMPTILHESFKTLRRKEEAYLKLDPENNYEGENVEITKDVASTHEKCVGEKTYSTKDNRNLYSERTISFLDLTIVKKQKKGIINPSLITECNRVFVRESQHVPRITNCDRVVIENKSSAGTIKNCKNASVKFGGRVDNIINCKTVIQETWYDAKFKETKKELLYTCHALFNALILFGGLYFAGQTILSFTAFFFASFIFTFLITKTKDYSLAKKQKDQENLKLCHGRQVSKKTFRKNNQNKNKNNMNEKIELYLVEEISALFKPLDVKCFKPHLKDLKTLEKLLENSSKFMNANDKASVNAIINTINETATSLQNTVTLGSEPHIIVAHRIMDEQLKLALNVTTVINNTISENFVNSMKTGSKFLENKHQVTEDSLKL